MGVLSSFKEQNINLTCIRYPNLLNGELNDELNKLIAFVQIPFCMFK